MQPRLRVALDANILIAGLQRPYWPFEVMRACTRGVFDVVLPEQVVVETRRHLDEPGHIEAFEAFLLASNCELLPQPTNVEVAQNLDLVRSEKDVPIAVALLKVRSTSSSRTTAISPTPAQRLPDFTSAYESCWQRSSFAMSSDGRPRRSRQSASVLGSASPYPPRDPFETAAQGIARLRCQVSHYFLRQ